MEVTRACSVQLSLDLGAPRCARHLVRLLVQQWGADDRVDLDAVALVVTELVTNVLAHAALEADPVVDLAVQLAGGALRVSVTDTDPQLPRQRAAADGDESGRGLAIIDRLSSAWGVEVVPSGKRVFADLPLAEERCA